MDRGSRNQATGGGAGSPASGLGRLLTSRAAADTLLVLVGRGAATAMVFALGMLLARVMGPGEYGLVKTSLTVMGFLAMLADFGTKVSLVRFIPHFRQQGRTDRQQAVLSSVFWFRIGMSVAIAAVVIPLSGPLARLIYQAPVRPILLLALAGAAGMALFEFVSAALQSEERFRTFTAMGVLDAGGKLALVGLLLWWGRLAVEPVLLVYLVVPLGAALVGASRIPRRAIWTRPEAGLFRDLMAYSRWNMVASLSMLALSLLDVLMLSALRSQEEVGYYSAALMLAGVVGLATQSLSTVFFPRVSRLQDAREVWGAIRRFSIPVLGAEVAALPLLALAPFLVVLLAGPAYQPSGPICRLLVADQMVILLAAPLYIAMYALNRPHIYAVTTVILLAANILGNLLYIPSHGALGAAWVTLVVRVLGYSLGGLWFWRELARGDGSIRRVVR